MYKFTIPVFGEGIVYDSPLDERQQQVKLIVHSMNTKGLEAMVPKMIDEAEDYFRAWGDEGEVAPRVRSKSVPSNSGRLGSATFRQPWPLLAPRERLGRPKRLRLGRPGLRRTGRVWERGGSALPNTGGAPVHHAAPMPPRGWGRPTLPSAPATRHTHACLPAHCGGTPCTCLRTGVAGGAAQSILGAYHHDGLLVPHGAGDP